MAHKIEDDIPQWAKITTNSYFEQKHELLWIQSTASPIKIYICFSDAASVDHTLRTARVLQSYWNDWMIYAFYQKHYSRFFVSQPLLLQ